MENLPASERIVLAVDTSEIDEAERLASIAEESGARTIKLGLELSSATSWHDCAELAVRHNLDWVADAKLNDIPNTVAATVRNISNLEHPPFAITMHTTAGIESMRVAQEIAGTIKMLGVTVLTSIRDDEVRRIFKTSPEKKVLDLARDAVTAGLLGVVASSQEVKAIKTDAETRDLLTMVPGTRSVNADRQDQARTTTPAQAIKNGADLLVIGRQVTASDKPDEAYAQVVKEIEAAS